MTERSGVSGEAASRLTKTERTRASLLAAYNDLVLHARQNDIRVPDVIKQADVGRSTFYEHYGSIDALHREALAHPMGTMADVLLGSGDAEDLRALLEHFWEYREQATDSLTSPKTRDGVVEVLYELLKERQEKVPGNVAMDLQTRQLSESTIALIRLWITGEIDCTADALCECLCATAALFRQGLNVVE